MGLTLQTGDWSRSIGSPAFFNSFFSTVFVLVESSSWGSQFPTVMNQLYAGQVSPTDAEAMRSELQRIQAALAEFAPSQVVWDFEDRSARPPWGDDIAATITSLANYFVTDAGEDLIETLIAAATAAQRDRCARRVD